MLKQKPPSHRRKALKKFIVSAALLSAVGVLATAHPLGNFTINHYVRIEIVPGRINLRCVVDMAEIPAFQELQKIGDGSPSGTRMNSYAQETAAKYAAGIELIVDGAKKALRVTASNASTPPGAGGLPTLRIECDLTAPLELTDGAVHQMRFQNANFGERIGWREVAVSAGSGFAVFNSSAYANNVTDELRAYPEDSLAAPLDERAVELSFI